MILFFGVFLLVVVASNVAAQQCGISQNVKEYGNTDQSVKNILGGKASNPSDWPFIVQISNGVGLCTATIIGRQWILSAAHCNLEGNPITVRTNDNTYSSTEFYPHEDYSPAPLFLNDVMLVKLSTPINFSRYVTNICLQRNVNVKAGDLAAVAGYGRIFDGVKDINSTFLEGIPINNINFNRTNLLHEVPVLIQDMKFCRQTEDESASKICAGGEMQGVTQGDSGGPLAVVRGQQWIQLGITSAGRFSGIQGNQAAINSHGIFARVSSYCDWINRTTMGEVKCQ